MMIHDLSWMESGLRRVFCKDILPFRILDHLLASETAGTPN